MATATQVKRYAIVGTGGRAVMFLEPICKTFKDEAVLVGMCDMNQGRLDYYQNKIQKDHDYDKVPTFLAEDFDKMVDQTKPDTIIVCTVDQFHHEYIIRALDQGCDVITEKPMTIDHEKCNAILAAVNRTGKNVRVTFNYRWGPGPSLVKELLQKNTIGEIIHVDMEYLLNTSHGADYFRRWHREKDKSGGLMVHKSTHHFDLVNWWIDATPQTVFGMGKLAFYGKENAKKRGVDAPYERYTGSDTGNDPFAFKLDEDDNTKALYLNNEQYDGYLRDQNVFGDNITIEDTMSVLVKYRTGAVLNYSLNAYLPREGFHVSINGTKGRLEYTESHASHIITGQSESELADTMKWKTEIIVQPMFGEPYEVEIPQAKGGHGGGDPKIQAQMFSNTPPEEVLGRNAEHEQGAASALIGIAANESFVTGLPVQIEDLCPDLPKVALLHELK